MDIMSLFRPAPANATPPAGGTNNPTQVAQPGNPLPGTQATPNTAPNGTVPAQGTGNPGDPGNSNSEAASPFGSFANVWDTSTNPNDSNPAGFFGNVDPAKLMESAKKVNFTNGIPAEQLQAIAGGGEAAVKAFGEVLNQVAQTVYAQGALASTKIVDQAMLKAQEGYDAKLPSMIRKLSVNENLRIDNPLLSNPAIAPLASALTDQLTRKNPNATSQEIQSQVVEYFNQLGSAFAPKVPENKSTRGKETDWEALFLQ